jgi:hypothetical protein
VFFLPGMSPLPQEIHMISKSLFQVSSVNISSL